MSFKENKSFKKRFKNKPSMQRCFKRYNKKGVDFAPINQKTEKILKQMGINIIGGACGTLIGAGIGFHIAGPPGALIGGVVGALTGVLVINGVIYTLKITKHRNGTFTADLQPA